MPVRKRKKKSKETKRQSMMMIWFIASVHPGGVALGCTLASVALWYLGVVQVSTCGAFRTLNLQKLFLPKVQETRCRLERW